MFALSTGKPRINLFQKHFRSRFFLSQLNIIRVEMLAKRNEKLALHNGTTASNLRPIELELNLFNGSDTYIEILYSSCWNHCKLTWIYIVSVVKWPCHTDAWHTFIVQHCIHFMKCHQKLHGKIDGTSLHSLIIIIIIIKSNENDSNSPLDSVEKNICHSLKEEL